MPISNETNKKETMYIHYSGNQITLQWTIYRGLSKVTEDFRRANLVCMFVSDSERFPVTPDVVSADGKTYLSIVVPEGLPEATYDILAVWAKNDDRSVAKSLRQQVFAVTDDPEEATDQGGASLETTLKFTSSAGTYGYDGLSAYEVALLKHLTNKPETEWVQEQIDTATDRIDTARAKDSATAQIASDLTHARNEIGNAQTTAINQIDAALDDAQQAIATTTTAAEGDINTAKDNAVDAINDVKDTAEADITDIKDTAVDAANYEITVAKTTAVEEVATSGGWANIIRDGSDDVDLMVTDDNGNKLAQFDGGHLRVKNFDSELAAVSAPDGTSIDFFVSDEDGNVIAAIHDGNIITKKFDSLQAETGKVPMYLTPQINTYVGDHLQLFKYPLTLLAEYENWGVSLSVKTDSNNVRKQGRTLRRYFEFTPTTTGTYTILASLCDRFHRVHFNGEFTVKVLSPTNPATKKNILVIGDSSVQGQTNNSGIPASEGASEDGTFCWTNEAKRLLTSNDTESVGMPAGLGLTNIQFIGTKNTSGGRNEGVGGVTAEYFTGSSSPFYKNGAINYNAYLGQNSVYEDTSRKGVDLIYICLGGNETMATTIVDGHLVRTKAAFKAHHARPDYLATDNQHVRHLLQPQPENRAPHISVRVDSRPRIPSLRKH